MNEKFLGFDDILNTDDVQYDVIDVPAWKGKIRVGSLSANDLLEFVEANEDPVQKRLAAARLLNKSLVDENGKRLGGPERETQLMKKDARVLTDIVQKILVLNGMDKKTSDAEKNASGEAPTDASPTDSPKS